MTISKSAAKTRKARPDGSGSIMHTSEGWRVQVRVYDEFTGKSRQIRRRARSRDHARNLLRELLKTDRAVRVSDPTITLADYLRSWSHQNLPGIGLAPSTVRIYRQCLLDYGIPAAASLTLRDLTPSQAQRWLSRVRETRKLVVDPNSGDRVRAGDQIAASSARNTYVAALRALDTAVRDGILRVNPLRGVDRPSVPRAAVPVTKPDETDRLLVACTGRRIEPLVLFVAFTGCRIGEALALRWEDVDLDSATVVIRRGSHARAATKSGKFRSITLLPEVAEALLSVRSRTRRERLAVGTGWHDAGLVFTSATGHQLDRSNVTHELQRALRAAGVTTERPWHSLRHGFAHRLLKKGVPLPLVSALLGHSGIAITADTYGHLDSRVPVEVLKEALER